PQRLALGRDRPSPSPPGRSRLCPLPATGLLDGEPDCFRLAALRGRRELGALAAGALEARRARGKGDESEASARAYRPAIRRPPLRAGGSAASTSALRSEERRVGEASIAGFWA